MVVKNKKAIKKPLDKGVFPNGGEEGIRTPAPR